MYHASSKFVSGNLGPHVRSFTKHLWLENAIYLMHGGDHLAGKSVFLDYCRCV